MDLFYKKILKSESRLSGKSVTRALPLLARYWCGYKLTGDRGFLNKANAKAAELLAENKSSAELCLCRVFLNIHLDNQEKAEQLLGAILPYRNYYKNNVPPLYCKLTYLRSLMALKFDKARVAFKSYNSLREYSGPEPLKYLLLGSLKVEMGHYEEALDLLEESYNLGCRSYLLFLCLRDIFEQHIPCDKKLLLQKYIGWAAAQEISLEKVLEYYENDDEDFFSGNLVAEKIYEAYPSEWVLKNICKNLFNKEDFSLKAYTYYREAEKRQIQLPELTSHLVKASHRNAIETLSRYTLNKFLQENDIDVGLRAFLYHLMLTNKKFKEIADFCNHEIIQFALYCIENSITDRYANSVYKHLLEAADEKIPESYISKAENILLEDLFYFDVISENPDIKNIWVSEKEKKATTAYKLEKGKARVMAITEFFSYVCFDQGVRRIIDEKLKVVKRIENADTELYLYFYKRGKTTPEILLALGKHFVAMEKPPESCADILREVLAVPGISRGFKIQISAALGNIFLDRRMYAEALECYRDVDENYLNDKYIERMLTVCINAADLKKAAELISKKSHCISERELFYALKQIATSEDCRPLIADVAYELILKSWYDKTLLDVVTKFYKGSQEEWQELSKALAAISASEPGLDEIILRNSIWMHKFDSGSQKVYARMYENSPDNDLIGMFTYYCIYEIMVGECKPSYDTIITLEKIFEIYNDHMLSYALSHVYLEKGMSTLKSDEIIKRAIQYMEEDDILLPVFKNSRDKKYNPPYIEKNQPFIYRSTPDKNVCLNYSFDGGAEYKSLKMKYFRFGLYLAYLPHFYGEVITYYFSEEHPTGSIVTKEYTVENTRVNVSEDGDPFFTINNALLYAQMFKYEKVEEIITDSLKELKNVRGKIL